MLIFVILLIILSIHFYLVYFRNNFFRYWIWGAFKFRKFESFIKIKKLVNLKIFLVNHENNFIEVYYPQYYIYLTLK